VKKESENLKAIVYTGPSMNPTFQNLDRLFYAPYKNSKIKRGDIIVFLDREKRGKVIHRIKCVNTRGIVTMGDNNSQPDPSILTSDQVIGRIICGKRRNETIRIHNGFLGTIQATNVRWIREMKNALYIILKPPYYYLSGKLKLPIRKRVLEFQGPEGKELQLVVGRVMIARLLPGERWQIRVPFRLFLDESDLPIEADANTSHKKWHSKRMNI
jgi:signal peptidase I